MVADSGRPSHVVRSYGPVSLQTRVALGQSESLGAGPAYLAAHRPA